MNNSELIWSNVFRYILLVMIQGLLLKELPELTHEYIQLFIYPLVLCLLPLGLAVPVQVLIGFVVGLSVDLFYGSIGVHAAASTLSTYIRNYIIAVFEPRAGFGTIPIPNVNLTWFMRYAGVFYAAHIAMYFIMEAFTLYYFGKTTIHTLVAWCISMIGVAVYMIIFNPKK
jgi:rod shape-determining protein MreD